MIAKIIVITVMIIFTFRNILIVYRIKRFIWINLILMEFLAVEISDYE